MGYLHFHLVSESLEREYDFIKSLSDMSEDQYTTNGPATHCAFTDLGEVVLVFPPQNGECLALCISDPEKFLEKDERGLTKSCPDEWHFSEDDVNAKGGFNLKTSVSFF